MALFVGEVKTTIDSKRRLAIPACHRDQIVPDVDGHDFFLILGPDRHLWLYPGRFYRLFLESIKRAPLPRRSTQAFDNLFYGTSRMLTPDAQGRIVLPDEVVQRAHVPDAVTLVGSRDHIEVWPTDEWDKHVDENLPNYGEMFYQVADQIDAELAAAERARANPGAADAPPTAGTLGTHNTTR